MGKKQFKEDPVEQYDDFFEAYNNLKLKNNVTNNKRDLGAAMAPKFQGYNTGINKSTYDSNFNWNAEADYNDIQGSIAEHRAQNQPWSHKAAAGLGRVGVKVVSEVAKMPGMIGGAIMAPFAKENEGWDTFVNNSWIRTINQMNEDINSEALPVYVKKAVSEGNLWDNISSIDFLH